MRSKKLFLFIISTFLLFTKSSYSENLAYVDIEFIMNNSLAGKSITQNLEKSFKDKDSKLNNIEKNGEYFGLKVQGDSMIEAGISEGDTVIVKKTDTAENGKIVVALIDDHEAMLKRIRRKGKTIALESANKNYETKIFGPDRVKVQGVLVSLYRNF